jgi:chromosome segregation ATPase
MGENTAEKLKIENDTFALKREYKYALENLAKVKAETVDILNTRDKAFADYEAKQVELTEILNRISDEKLAWSTHRHAELVEIEKQQEEVNKVLNQKDSLLKKEADLVQKEDDITSIRNEARAIEFKNKQKETELENRENALQEKLDEIEVLRNEVEVSKSDFKSKVANLLEQVQTL